MLKMSKKIKRILIFPSVLFTSVSLSSCTNLSKAKQYANISKIENFFSIKSANYYFYYEIQGRTSIWSRRFHDDESYIAKTLKDNPPAEISYQAYVKILKLDSETEWADYSYLLVKSDAAPQAELKISDEYGLISVQISNNGEKLNREGSSRYYIADEKVNKQILDFALAKAEDENPIHSEELSLF